MRGFKKTAGIFVFILSVIFLVIGTSYAGYEFDDLMGNGYTAQWMAINQIGATLGGKFNEPIVVSSDMLGTYDTQSVINILSGNSDEEITDRELHVLFLLLCQGYAEFYTDLKAEELSFDVSTPDSNLSTIVNMNSTPYISQKTAMGKPDDKDANWSRYKFTIARNINRELYDTVVQSFNFHQNPAYLPSQTIPRPLVISNVRNATAASEPLILRMALREDNATGNIVAYDRTTWDLTSDKTAGGTHWVFVPLEDDLLIDNQRINYYLTTEVVNHTAVRYANQPYDSEGSYVYPYAWKFDLTREQGNTEITREFQLAKNAQIPPGLVTIFKRSFNINEQNKRPLRLYPVDAPDIGRYDLRLNHRIIYGKKLGEKYSLPASEGKFNLFEIMPFQPKTNGSAFYDRVKEVTLAQGEVVTPTTTFFSGSAVKRTETTPSSVLQHFTIDQTIPGNLRTTSADGMLPLHITFNIPVTQIEDRTWLNTLIAEWRRSGRIEDKFAEKYEIFLQAETNGQPNPWNLTQQLQNHNGKNYYNDQIKVFFDEDRGRSGQDNDRGLITVSFIVMLMDGTRDGVRPELSMVEDYSISQQNDYIIIRDGMLDNKWKLTFFIAPAGYQDNPGYGQTGGAAAQSVSTTLQSFNSTRSGGCNLGAGALLVLVAIAGLSFRKSERR